ncbi:hypothetical protein BT67DRAFT_440691 [Trichocladium antarcticum]|uniref:Uncharacterized protein n=1 Tax=Trichocladium antarcticum TaxID=1450529 RepID=A0AAN6UMK8_9PEZI|nr:hypothetical protein BT67DRAFT_440691 [Trichocladium antarcticum]
MHPSHTATIDAATAHFRDDPSVLALLLRRSIAPAVATPAAPAASPVRLFILLTEEAYAARAQSLHQHQHQHQHQLSVVACSIGSGAIDARYLSVDVMRQVAARGSETARYAFDGAEVVYRREGVDVVELEEVIERVVEYPVAGKAERVRRFRGQLEVWRGLCGEGRKNGDEYLLGLAVRRLILFGGRLVLAHNAMLYPSHASFLRVLERAPYKPRGLMACIDRALANPSGRNVEAFYVLVNGFQDWGESPTGWGSNMLDDELTWMTDTPADDW